MAARESIRIKDNEKKRVIDEATRLRRIQKALDALEQDNYHDDPHADLVMNKKAPKFDDSLIADTQKRKRKQKNTEYYKLKSRKSFMQLLEEDKNVPPPNYSSAIIGPSEYPARKLCAVCGYFSTYTCVSCGSKYCSARCYATHIDTRCLKWVS